MRQNQSTPTISTFPCTPRNEHREDTRSKAKQSKHKSIKQAFSSALPFCCFCFVLLSFCLLLFLAFSCLCEKESRPAHHSALRRHPMTQPRLVARLAFLSPSQTKRAEGNGSSSRRRVCVCVLLVFLPAAGAAAPPPPLRGCLLLASSLLASALLSLG